MATHNYTQGVAKAAAFRWHPSARPGCYVVNVSAEPGSPDEYTELHGVPGYQHETAFDFGANFQAVVDNYGRLVKVPGNSVEAQ